MPNALIPELNGRTLTVDVALRQPTMLRNQIAKLADEQILLPRLFRTLGAKVTGGGLLYSVIAASDFFSTAVEKRTPGAEYRVVEGVDPEPKVAPLEDWGGKFSVTDEQRSRNEVNYLDQQTTQLANTIVRRLDVAAGTAYLAQGGMVGTVGFEAPLTTDTWDDRSIRSTWVQSYCVPAIAVDRPFACKSSLA